MVFARQGANCDRFNMDEWTDFVSFWLQKLHQKKYLVWCYLHYLSKFTSYEDSLWRQPFSVMEQTQIWRSNPNNRCCICSNCTLLNIADLLHFTFKLEDKWFLIKDVYFLFRWEMLVRVVKGKVMGESWSQWTNFVNVEDHAPIPGIAERVPVIAERVPERAEAKVMVVNEEDRDLPKDHIDLMSNLVVMLISPLLFVDCTHFKPLYVIYMNCEFVELISPTLKTVLLDYWVCLHDTRGKIQHWKLKQEWTNYENSTPVGHAHVLFNFKISMYYT